MKMKTRYKILIVAICAYFAVFFGPVIASNVYCDFISQEMCTSRITGVVLPPFNLIMYDVSRDDCFVNNDGVLEPCYIESAGLLEWPFSPRITDYPERNCDDMCPDQPSIDTITQFMLSNASRQEKITEIANQVKTNSLEPFSVVAVKNLKQNYEYGENVTFDLINFGYVNWCLMPSFTVFYEYYERPFYDDAIVHSCPPPSPTYAPRITEFNHDDFRDVMVCKYEGTYTIMAESFSFEKQKIGQFYCNGKDKFVAPSVHELVIPKGVTNPNNNINFEPDSINAHEDDVFRFVNSDDTELWLVARHDSDERFDIYLHLDSFETREFSQIKSGYYKVTLEIDHKPVPLMNAIIHVE